MSRLDRWLEEQIPRPASITRPTLVLCRSEATLHTVRSWLARQQGRLGVEVATPKMIAAQLDGPWLSTPAPSTTELPASPFNDQIRDRPGLVALARQWVRTARNARAADPELRLPDWLAQLADSPWYDDTPNERRLLALARANGSRLTASLTWSTVHAIGFVAPLDPWTTALHEALVGPVGQVPKANLQPFDTEHHVQRTVPDPSAEARHAAEFASVDPSNTLVLVQHPATAARVHRALVRNHIDSAWRGSLRLERHTLSSVIRRCVPWFHGRSDPNIRATDLHTVLKHPMLAMRLPPAAERWLRERLEELDDPFPDRTTLSTRELTRAITRARHLDAPLSRWLHETEGLMSRADEPRTPGRAARLHARLRVLQASVQSRPFAPEFGEVLTSEPEDFGDFDALVAGLLGDRVDAIEDAEIAPTGTLGALRRFLLACRVRTRDDPAALRILGALRKGAHRPATRVDALQCLQGVVERPEVSPGVEIMTYEAYDGRPTDRLVLLDVHDQGVAARERPNPLLTESQLRELGELDARRRVAHRLEQLRRASQKSDSSILIVTRNDAMGRATVPPIQLALPKASSAHRPYGLDVALPERDRRRSLVTTEASTWRPPSSKDRAAHLAVGATVDWWRAGRGPSLPPTSSRPIPGSPTLAHHLATRPVPHDALRPWLGYATAVEEAHLDPSIERSVSRFFRPATHCLYQAFVKNQLRIDEPETLSDELDAKQIGNAVHDALEHAAAQGGWWQDGQRGPVLKRFEEALVHHTDASFSNAKKHFGALSPARSLATDGLKERWTVHWSRYAEQRTRSTPPSLAGARRDLLRHHVAMSRARTLLAETGRAEGLPALRPYQDEDWLTHIVGQLHHTSPENLSADAVLASRDRFSLDSAWLEAARRVAAHPRLFELYKVVQDIHRLSDALLASSAGVMAELGFGHKEGTTLHLGGDLHDVELGTLELDLHRIRVPVSGSIDRIQVVGDPKAPFLRIIDYKTGRNAPSRYGGLMDLLQLKDPQLVVYALVLRQALREGKIPLLQHAQVATVGWDHLRAAKRQGDAVVLSAPEDGFLLDDATLDLLSRVLGGLLHRTRLGEWPLAPRHDTCPELRSYGHDYCPYAGACRFRGLPEKTP